MLHQHHISFRVDYKSSKPLIKPCSAQAFIYIYIYNYLSVNENKALRFTDWGSQRNSKKQTSQASHKLLSSTKQFVLTEVCLWGTFSIHLVLLLNNLTSAIALWGAVYSRDLVGLRDLRLGSQLTSNWCHFVVKIYIFGYHTYLYDLNLLLHHLRCQMSLYS